MVLEPGQSLPERGDMALDSSTLAGTASVPRRMTYSPLALPSVSLLLFAAATGVIALAGVYMSDSADRFVDRTG